MAKTPCTKETYDKLVERYTFLKKVERPRVVDEMEEARKQGDLSENAEYHAAKEMLCKTSCFLYGQECKWRACYEGYSSTKD